MPRLRTPAFVAAGPIAGLVAALALATPPGRAQVGPGEVEKESAEKKINRDFIDRPSGVRRTSPPPFQPQVGVTWITRAMLAERVPNTFWYDYPYAPNPGKRLWLRVDDRHFVERQPGGRSSRFLIFGHAEVRGISGTVAIKLVGDDPARDVAEDDGGFQVFIPDKGAPEAEVLFNQSGPAAPDWADPAWPAGRQTTMRGVE